MGRSDQLIRAYAGERLAELQSRLDGDAADALEPLIERAAFADQRDLVALERPKEEVRSADAVLAADADLLDAADDAASVDAAQLGAYIEKVKACFDARDASLVAAGVALG
ncbi:MAG TPA: hypothetical protein VFN49_03755 [Candidatus Aquilonibacter sp.]|nr:hypothetical protein [Candidatus Aquilonibacter sp.]